VNEFRVFISHSSHNNEFAHLLASRLRDPDVLPWIDTEQIYAGDDILDQLGEGLSRMDILVFLASEHSLASEWVDLEVKYAYIKELSEKRALILPFIIDNTHIRDIPWFLQHRNATRVSPDPSGVETIVKHVHHVLDRRNIPEFTRSDMAARFVRDSRIEELIANVGIGDWDAAYDAALQLHSFTQPSGFNELFPSLLVYIDYPEDDDRRWGALLTIEAFAQLAPWLYTRAVLFRLGEHSDFSVRSSAASICMELASIAPHLVPTDLAFKLSRFDEDWYVMAPALAALKALCSSRPIVIRAFFNLLHSDYPYEREHAASAIADIAHTEPEILDQGELSIEARRLQQIGDELAASIIADATTSVQDVDQQFRYKYGL